MTNKDNKRSQINIRAFSKAILFTVWLLVFYFTYLAATDIIVNPNINCPPYDGSSTHPYLTIQAAINSCSGTNNYNILAHYNDNGTAHTYTENIQIHNKDCTINIFSGNDSTVDEYEIGKVIIDGNSSGSCISIDSSYTVIINGLKLINGNGCDVTLPDGTTHTKRGGGIYSKLVSNLIVKNCEISNNSANRGGGIYLHADRSYIDNCEINNNNLMYNSATPFQGYGVGIYLSHGKADISNCKIHHNIVSSNCGMGAIGHSLNDFVGTATFYESWYDLTLSNSQIYSNSVFQWGSAITLCYQYPTNNHESFFTMINCTIVKNHRTNILLNQFDCAVLLNKWSWDNNMYYKIYNTIIRDNTYGSGSLDNQLKLTLSGGGSIEPDSVYNCNIHWTSPGNLDPSNIDSNPLFVDEVNHDYRLKWQGEDISPCIDRGCPDTDGDGLPWYKDIDDQDRDGSQKDIGAIPFEDHVHGAHILKGGGRVAWVSFPGIINPDMGNPEEHSPLSSYANIFNEFRENQLLGLDPVIIQDFKCKTNGDDIALTYSSLTNPLFDPNVFNEMFVCSQYGYKIQINAPTSEEEKVIEYQGYRPGYEQNSGMWNPMTCEYTKGQYIRRPDGGINCYPDPIAPNYDYREIYLGYYLKESMDPYVALGPILDKVVAILTKTWGVWRLPSYNAIPDPNNPMSYYTNNWIGRCIPGIQPTINPGEMMVVKYLGTEDVSFHWGAANPDPYYTEPYYREMPAIFEYEEQPEYVPIFLQLDLSEYGEGEKPVEIAVFVNEECKGAAVIKEDQVQLNAYILNIPNMENEELEFVMYFLSKNAKSKINSYKVMDNKTGRYQTRKVKAGECKEFLCVSLKSAGTTPIMPQTVLKNNYPNPFNPETTISFDLAKSGKAKLEVYNAKGQLVKTLLMNDIEAGSHTIKWNGTDDNKKQSASGIYFYKLTTNGKTLTKKMLLMK